MNIYFQPTTNNIFYQRTKRKSNSTSKYPSNFINANVPDLITQVQPSFNNKQSILQHNNSLTPPHSNESHNILLPAKANDNKKTLILDLDETLVHSSFTNINPFQKADVTLTVNIEGNFYNIFVLVRPWAVEFIKEMSERTKQDKSLNFIRFSNRHVWHLTGIGLARISNHYRIRRLTYIYSTII